MKHQGFLWCTEHYEHYEHWGCCRLSLLDLPAEQDPPNDTLYHPLVKAQQNIWYYMLFLNDSFDPQWLQQLQQNQVSTDFILSSSFLNPFLILSSSSSFSPFLVLQSSSPPVLVHHLVLHQAINPLKQSLCSAPCLRCSGHNVTALKIWRSTSDEIYEIYLCET